MDSNDYIIALFLDFLQQIDVAHMEEIERAYNNMKHGSETSSNRPAIYTMRSPGCGSLASENWMIFCDVGKN